VGEKVSGMRINEREWGKKIGMLTKAKMGRKKVQKSALKKGKYRDYY